MQVSIPPSDIIDEWNADLEACLQFKINLFNIYKID